MKKLNLILLLFSTYISASNISASYNGNTGVFETPNARIMPDWHMRVFFNEDNPFSYYGAAINLLPFLETNFHITKIDGVEAFGGTTNYGDNKDKSLSFKLQVKEEGKYMPALAIGADDVWGTALYTSKYIAASKKIGYFDFTLGYAKGRLGGENLKKYDINTSNTGSVNNPAFKFLTNTSWGGGKPFGSVVFDATEDLSLMAEYSPIEYKYDKSNPFTSGDMYKEPESNFNYGLKYKWGNNSIFSLSYQRGNTLSFGYTYQFGFDRTGLFEHLPDTKWKADEKKLKEYENLSEKELADKLSNEVAAERFRNVTTSVNGNKIWSEITNTRYHNDLKAVGRAISTIDEVAPEKYDTIYMTLKNKYTPTKTFKVNRKEFDLYENDKLSDDYMEKAVEISLKSNEKYNEFIGDKENVYKTNLFDTKRFKWNIAPKIRTYLNHDDKPFAIKVSARATSSYDITDNLSIEGAIEQPVYHTGKDLSSKPLEDEKLSLRSDITDTFVYNDTQMPYLSASFVDKMFDESFYKIEAGYLEYAFAGVDLEWYKPMFDDKFGVGLQYQKVYKRKVDNLFKVKNDYSYDAAFLNIFYQAVPKYNINLGLKIGKFLAGDKGVKVELTRHYKDFSIGVFATATNSKDVFKNEDNRGYIDKGVYIKFPLETFHYKNMKKRVTYGLKPWTRDVGQYSNTRSSLYPMSNSENNTQIMKNNIKYLKY